MGEHPKIGPGCAKMLTVPQVGVLEECVQVSGFRSSGV